MRPIVPGAPRAVPAGSLIATGRTPSSRADRQRPTVGPGAAAVRRLSAALPLADAAVGWACRDPALVVVGEGLVPAPSVHGFRSFARRPFYLRQRFDDDESVRAVSAV
jgi:hypothetical protein